MSKIKILFAPTLELAKSVDSDISIEAEYGAHCVEGRLYTAAHHGERGGNPAPCVDENIPHLKDGGTILVSHFDLDALGAVFRALGKRWFHDEFAEFWKLAAFVDIHGLHQIGEFPRGENYDQAFDLIHAWWAWAESDEGKTVLRPHVDRDNPEIIDVTDRVLIEIGPTMHRLLTLVPGTAGWKEDKLLIAGRKFRALQEGLNEASFVQLMQEPGGRKILLRVGTQFVNHLYATPSGEVADCVVGYKTTTGAMTLSFEKECGLDANAIMQDIFGSEAGGHRGIAGSPRNERVDYLAGLINILAKVGL